MPYKDPHSERAIMSRKKAHKRYSERNKEKIAEKDKKYYQKNKDKIKEYQKTSPIFYKTKTIYSWKRQGIIDDDYDLLFEVYNKETHCWICGKEYVKRNDRQLDHDHETGEPRYICCISCNCKLK